MPGLAVPEHLLRKIRPRRSIAGSAKAPSKRAVSTLRKKMAERTARTHLDVLAAGVGGGPEPQLAPIQEAAVALLRGLSGQALAAASIDELAAASLFVWRAGQNATITDSVVVVRGLTDAVTVAVRALGYALGAPDGGWMTRVWLTTGPRWRRFRLDDGLDLRHAACAAPEAEYEQARAWAAEARADLELHDRAFIAHAFPDEPWADEDLRALLSRNDTDFARYGNLLSAARDPSLVAELCTRYPFGVGVLALDIACGLPPDDATSILAAALPPMLQKPKYGALMKTPPRTVATALAMLRTRRAAEILAPYLGHAILGAVAAELFQDNPELSGVLDTHATTRGARAAAERIRAQHGDDDDGSPVAAADAVPALLRERPWRPRKTKAKPTVVDAALPDDVDEGVDVIRIGETVPYYDDAQEMPAEALTQWRARVAAAEWACADYEYVYGAGAARGFYQRIPPEDGLRAWNEGRAYVNDRARWVARHGLAALPGFLLRTDLKDLDYEDAEATMSALECYVTPRMAPLMARIAARRKKYRLRALRWLEHHHDTVVVGLIPDAVGPAGPPRVDAEEALLALARSGRAEAIRVAASRCGGAAAAAVDALLSRDPLAIDARPIKLPKLLRPDDLPPLRLKNGARLPDGARDAFVEMLSVAPPGYAGFDRLRDACDADSLTAFTSALLEQWVLGDAPGRHDWMLHAAVRLPSEQTTRRVAALARDWARSKKAKAVRACGALGALGTDVALLHLGHVAETSRFDDLRALARELLDDAARARGLSRDELEDRTVPDLGLAADGTLTLSFGARAFVATLDETLSVVLRDAEGNRLPSAPRTRKDDDGAAAKTAKARLAQLQKDVVAIADRQIRRMERAMVDGRWFSRDDFTTRIASHPVLMHLAQGLVWEARTAAGTTRTFRVDEGGTFATVDDDPATLDDVEAVRVAHPMRTDLAAWAQLFADYERSQPFEQLGRERLEPTAAEREATSCERAAGTTLAAPKLLGLFEARGYRRNDRGYPRAFIKKLPGDVEVEVPFDPGIDIAYLKTCGEQTLAPARFTRRGEPVAIADLDPVAFMEAARDLEALRR